VNHPSMVLKSSAWCHGCRAPCPQALSFVRPPVRGTVLNAWVPRAEQCTCSILFHPPEVKTVKRDSHGNSSAACHGLLDESPDHYLRYLRPRVFWRFQINSDARRCAAKPPMVVAYQPCLAEPIPELGDPHVLGHKKHGLVFEWDFPARVC
jgi:hypothetical protein